MAVSTASTFSVNVRHFQRGDFSNYSVVGQGAEGAVYRATHNTFGKVAVKTLSPSVHVNDINEIQILVQCRHNHIVVIYGILRDQYESKRCAGYVMELMEEGNLSQVIHGFKQYDVKHVYKWIEQIGYGLNYLHEQKIIHRDVKPNNILVVSIDHLKLADFGFARKVAAGISISRLRGTSLYMAPEVIKTSRYGKEADIYSFAISIWEMIHRQKPYSEFDSEFDVLKAVSAGKRPLLDLSRIDQEMKLLLQRGWNEKPAERGTIVEMIEFAKRMSLVNKEGTCQLMMQLEKNENGMVTTQAENLEYPSTILTYSNEGVFILSQDKSHWKTLSLKLPLTHSCGGFAYLNGEIFIFGGGGFEKKTYKCGHQKEWIHLADMNERRGFIGNSTVVFEGHIWVFGGEAGMVNILNTVEKYIPDEDKWIQMPKMQQRRSDAAAAVCDGKFYVSGGFNYGTSNSVECLDPNTNIWTMFVDLPTPLWGHSMILDRSSLIVLGGSDGQEDCKTVWKINTKEENPTWKTMPSMMEDRSYFSAVSLENRIYAIGGFTKETASKTVEIFNGESWEAGPEFPGIYYPVSVVIPSHVASAL